MTRRYIGKVSSILYDNEKNSVTITQLRNNIEWMPCIGCGTCTGIRLFKAILDDMQSDYDNGFLDDYEYIEDIHRAMNTLF